MFAFFPTSTAAFLLFVAAILAPASPRESDATTDSLQQLPPKVADLKERIQRKSPDEVRSIMIDRFGPNFRNVGSGIQIVAWDLPEGRLTFHPAAGPIFRATGKKTIWLIDTHNPAKENLLGSYEMFTSPMNAHGNRSWLGNLKLGADGSYSYKENKGAGKLDAWRNHFFHKHSSGKFEIVYTADVSEDTLLEKRPSGSIVAELRFRSDTGAEEPFSIKVLQSERRLVFGGTQPLPFEMRKSWNEYWK